VGFSRKNQPAFRLLAACLAFLCAFGALSVASHHATHQRQAADGAGQAQLHAPDSDCLLCRYEAQLLAPGSDVEPPVPAPFATRPVPAPVAVVVYARPAAAPDAPVSRGPPA
jgi:hypothetical protein